MIEIAAVAAALVAIGCAVVAMVIVKRNWLKLAEWQRGMAEIARAMGREDLAVMHERVADQCQNDAATMLMFWRSGS